MCDPEDSPDAVDEQHFGDRTVAVFACEQCTRRVVHLESGATPECHAEPMQRIAETTVTFTDLRQFLSETSPFPASGLDTCLALFETRLCSTVDLSERLGYDRETVTAQIDRLVEAGHLERTSLSGETGGEVNVYYRSESSPPWTLTGLCEMAATLSETDRPSVCTGSENTLADAFIGRFCEP